jgi:hypothetical protein
MFVVHSTQFPDEQCCPAGQALQLLPQCESSVLVLTQDPMHVVGLSDGQPHTPLPEHICPEGQALVSAPVQVPMLAPLLLQCPATLAVIEFAHPVAPQVTVLPGNVQLALDPSHTPAQGGVPGHAMRAVLTFAHVPVEQD